MTNPRTPFYPYPPIGSRVALARMLKCSSVDDLSKIERNAENLYRIAKRVKKSDGTVRLCYDANPPLKSIHARIQCLILKKVKFPSYLMGGISDPACPRDYVRNAELHLDAQVVVNEDVSSFFPSTSTEVVYDIWRNFFKFPDDVATSLTRLTTKDGGLPQGAKTSSYLANLAFWRTEPRIYETLTSQGFRYSRYVDDIGLSSQMRKSNRELGSAITQVTGMVHQHGLKVNRKKHKVMRSSCARVVTGLNVDARATMNADKRDRLRAMVHRCELLALDASAEAQFSQLMQKALGMVGQLKRLHPTEAAALRVRLKAVQAEVARRRSLCGA
jgi:Reverse transcriptase (RNA-dependent DNA polymerase)